MTHKTTKHHLVEALKARNENGKYNTIIARAANNGYHDHKFDKIPGHPEYGDCNCPKIKLVEDLQQFPELIDITQDVMQGVYDEPADATDQEEMRGWLIEDEASDHMFEMLGLKLPTDAERKLKRVINN